MQWWYRMVIVYRSSHESRTSKLLTLIHLLDFKIVGIVVHFYIHVVPFVIGYDRKSVVRAIEGNPDRLSVANPIGEDQNRQWIEQVALDCAIERARPIDRRIAGGAKEVLRVFVYLEGHLPF